MRRYKYMLEGVASLMLFSSAVHAIDARPTGQGINVMTRYMQLFSDLETRLHQAINQRDKPQLDVLLSAFFEIRQSNGVNRQLEDWLRTGDMNDGSLDQLAVYEMGDNAVVSFLQRESDKPAHFIVDVWTQQAGRWQLRVRFDSPQ